MRDIQRADKALVAGLQRIAEARADVLVLTDIDYDHAGVALGMMRDHLANAGMDYPHAFTARPNRGWPSGLDMDGDGRLGEPEDAFGYGWFSGQGGMAILSRWPVTLDHNFSQMLWKDVPDSLLELSDPAADQRRLSSSGHWMVQVDMPKGHLRLLTLTATPPVFDGPEDLNGRRNRDEVMFFGNILSGRGPSAPPDGPLAVMGNFNLDPGRGEGLREAVRYMLGHPKLTDPLPGQPTAMWEDPGHLRVSYVLPSTDFTVVEAGLMPEVPDLGAHRLVWVDVIHPGPEQAQ